MTIKNQQPVFFETPRNKKTFLCINQAVQRDDRSCVCVDNISYDTEYADIQIMDALGIYDGPEVCHLDRGDSYTTEDGKTVIVRIA